MSAMRWIGQAVVLCVVAGAHPAAQVRAEAPGYLPVQGYLTNAGGDPVEGPISIRFRLYDRAEPTGAASEILFEEQLPAVAVAEGFFTVYLGDTKPLDLGLFRDHPIVFVGVLVSGDTAELEPLLQIATAPYAGYAQYCGEAATLQGKGVSDFLPSSYTPQWSALTGTPTTFPPSSHQHAFGDLTDVPNGLADGDNDSLAGLSCSTGQIPRRSGSGWVCANDIDAYNKTQSDARYTRLSGCYWKTGTCPTNGAGDPPTCNLLCDGSDVVISGGCSSASGATLRETMPRFAVNGPVNGKWPITEMTGWYCRTSAGQLNEIRIMCCPPL